MKKNTIGIIGGTGSMGRWFQRFFSDNGHRVLISGRTTSLGYRELAGMSDIVILSVPLKAAMHIAEDIGHLMNDNQLLMDFCSLKEDILKRMLSATDAQVLGCHPLFGPMTESLKKQNIVFCSGRGTYWAEWLAGEFEAHHAVVTYLDASVHDKHMAVVQGLTHLIMICLGRTMQTLNMTPDAVLSYSTPVFRMKLDLVGRLFAQDLTLFHNLVRENKHLQPIIQMFLDIMKTSGEQLISGTSDQGMAYLEDIQGFLGPLCRQGLEESNRLIQTIYPK